MLENWNKPQIPEDDELEERLHTARAKLSSLAMQIKEHGLPVLVLFAGGFIVFKKKKDDPGSTETGQCGGEPDGQTQEDGTGPKNEGLPDAPETAEGESEPSSQQEMTDGQQNIQNKEEKI